jgi:YtkA-like protein
MKKILAFAMILLFAAGIAYAKDYEVKKKVGEYNVEVKIDNPRVGPNNIKIEVKDESGKYVTDAKINVKYSMPEGIDWPPMHFTTDAKLEGQEYSAKIKIPMPGTWATVVSITRGGKTSSMKFNIEAHKK